MSISTLFQNNPTPFLTDIQNKAVDPDQITACYRFLLRPEFDQEVGSRVMIKKLLSLFESYSSAHMDALRNAQNSINADYNTWNNAFPGFPYLSEWEKNTDLRTLVNGLSRQIVWECDNFGMDPMIFKGCILGWAKTTQGMSEFAEKKLRRALRYRGKAIFFAGTKNIFTTPYKRIRKHTRFYKGRHISRRYGRYRGPGQVGTIISL
jgi:hypothetical protein